MVVKFLLHSHVLFILHFFVLRMFVPIMLLSTQRQSHGLASDRASMCTHIHIQWQLYWKWLFMIDCEASRRTTRRQKKQKGTREERDKVMAIVRTVANKCMFDAVPIFQSILLIPSLSFLLYFDISNWSQNDRSIKHRRKKSIYIYMYTADCHFLLIQVCVHSHAQGKGKTTSTILPYWSNQFCRQDHNNSFQPRHRLSPSLGATYWEREYAPDLWSAICVYVYVCSSLLLLPRSLRSSVL